MSGIFISYRRSASQHFARSIFSELQVRGHDVFLDINSIDSGAFDNIIRNQIAARPHFLLILSKGSLERCANKGDWLLEEIQEAVRLNRNIVPVYDDGFKFDDEKHFLPEGLQKLLSLQNAPPYSHYYFKAFIDALSDRFFRDKVDNLPITPTPPTEQAEVQKRIEQAAQPDDGWTPQVEVTRTPQPILPETQAALNAFVKRAAQVKQEIETPKPAQPLIWGVENILPPPFEWVYIPQGNVTINNHTSSVGVFQVAKYPITHAQFKTFIQAQDGYNNRLWWDHSSDSREWRSKNDRVSLQTSLMDTAHPIENVSWYEAFAFCNWLSERFNSQARELPPVKITLPTERQWLRAAQGDDNRTYPWGMGFDFTRCNTKVSSIGRTTPVTEYPNGASPYGVMDMSGNVFEMCLDILNYYAGIRGGSWKTDSSRANLNYREDVSVGKRLETIGFRIVMMNS